MEYLLMRILQIPAGSSLQSGIFSMKFIQRTWSLTHNLILGTIPTKNVGTNRIEVFLYVFDNVLFKFPLRRCIE